MEIKWEWKKIEEEKFKFEILMDGNKFLWKKLN